MFTSDKRMRMSAVAALVLLAAVFAQISSGKKMANYGSMKIDPNTLKVRLRDELPFPKLPTSDYYFRFQLPDGRYTVDHFAAGGKVRYNAFFVGADNAISTRTKD